MIGNFLRQSQKQPTTIIHVGAHLAEELNVYLGLMPKHIIFIEADPDIYKRMVDTLKNKTIPPSTKVILVNALVTDSDNIRETFYRFNNDGASSSIYPGTELLRSQFRGLSETGEVLCLMSTRLDTLINNISIELGQEPVLILDIQGAELRALKGLGALLSGFTVLEVEVSEQEIYQGQPLLSDIDEFLQSHGFSRLTGVKFHGDVIYTRREKRDQASLAGLKEDRQTQMVCAQQSTLLAFSGKSKSQLRQDIFVLSELGFKRDGYFVEFGATNGKDLSNTWLLEKEFNWRGILCEPASVWHNDLRKNRSSIIDTRCVWSASKKQLNFMECNQKELSSVFECAFDDFHANSRASGRQYSVETVSLEDLLSQHDAPMDIDYLSIDTEGSEFEILSAFNFEKYKIKIITVEHNYTASREKIQSLLLEYGYDRKYPYLSQFDDWYVRVH